mmetsp:Transcript_26016/g.89758  ORF Transcript_26016/g.89758 Transcript_26016/m.89758 type:complete len:120 (+) Transcript_26016:60-419(+)
MQRAVCPERVPFRLTQLLVNSMEASGVEGSFRLTCRAALAALRSDAPSLMALLEAVVYDPLHVWRKGEAVEIVDKIEAKLSGARHGAVESVPDQVDALIADARAHENLCQMFAGWLPYL